MLRLEPLPFVMLPCGMDVVVWWWWPLSSWQLGTRVIHFYVNKWQFSQKKEKEGRKNSPEAQDVKRLEPLFPPLLSPSLAHVCPSVDVGDVGVDGVWWWLARSSRHDASQASNFFLQQFASKICNKTFVSTKKYKEREKIHLLGPKRHRLASFGPTLPFQLSPFHINHRYNLYIQQNFSQYLYSAKEEEKMLT